MLLQILRVQGKSGTKRFDVQNTDTLRSLVEKVNSTKRGSVVLPHGNCR